MEKNLMLDGIFCDGMILQRDEINKIYGYEKLKDKVSISFKGKDYSATVNQEGYWEIEIEPMKNGGPYEMRIKGSREVILSEIYMGDVFLLGGQSNMELPLQRVKDIYQGKIELNSGVVIRQYTMPKEYAFRKKEYFEGSNRWLDVDRKTIDEFSAIGYFFARKMQSYNPDIHIGLIQTAVGGSPIEAWCNEVLVNKYRAHQIEDVVKYKDESLCEELIKQEESDMNQWLIDLKEKDKLQKAILQQENVEQSGWKTISIPSSYKEYKDLKGINGVVWLRKKIDIDEEMASEINNDQTILYCGAIVDADEIYINGKMIGSTAYRYPPRKYIIPKGTMRGGQNEIWIRHIIMSGEGEFIPGKPYHIMTKNKKVRINLRGEWLYKIGGETKEAPSSTFLTWKPTALYYSMIYRLRRQKVKGILWYQGESNTDVTESYGNMFIDMIELFRHNFENDKLPFSFVQLSAFGPKGFNHQESGWPRIRQEQERALGVNNTEMVVSIDKGEYNDIHPIRKQPIGERLADCMQKLLHDNTIVCSGPVIKEISINKSDIVLMFENVGEGLIIKKELVFNIYIKDQGWKMVKGTLFSKDKVIVTEAEEVEVRGIEQISYCYSDYPEYVAIYNSHQFPCPPFNLKVER